MFSLILVDAPEPTEEPSRVSDLDECTVFGADQLCSQICVDTPGSYRCECNQGYKLAMDGRTCYRDSELIIFDSYTLKLHSWERFI